MSVKNDTLIISGNNSFKTDMWIDKMSGWIAAHNLSTIIEGTIMTKFFSDNTGIGNFTNIHWLLHHAFLNDLIEQNDYPVFGGKILPM